MNVNASARPFRLTSPVIPETDIHEACASALDRLLLPPAVWFTYPAGLIALDGKQISRYIRAGLKRALPDIWVLHDGVYCVELKRLGGELSRTRIVRTRRGSTRELIGQREMFPRLLAAGVRDIGIAHSVEEMLVFLERHRIPLRPHHR